MKGARRQELIELAAGQTVAVRDGISIEDLSTLIGDHHGTAGLSITNVSATTTHRYSTPFDGACPTEFLAGPTASGMFDAPMSGFAAVTYAVLYEVLLADGVDCAGASASARVWLAIGAFKPIRIAEVAADTATVADRADAIRDSANAGAHLDIQNATRIEKQLGKRGWTRDSLEDLIAKPARTVSTRDTRHLPGGGRNDAPAAACINEDGGYVVRNDESGDIVQVSNLNDPDWKSPW